MCECSHWEICLVFRLYLEGLQQLSTHLEIEQNFNSGGLPTFTSHIYWLNKLKLIKQTMVDISQETPVGLEKLIAAWWKLFNKNIRLCYLNASIATITMSQMRMSADCRGFYINCAFEKHFSKPILSWTAKTDTANCQQTFQRTHQRPLLCDIQLTGAV